MVLTPMVAGWFWQPASNSTTKDAWKGVFHFFYVPVMLVIQARRLHLPQYQRRHSVTVSKPATLTNGQLIGDNTNRGLWQHEYDQSLHLYTIEGNAGWIVVADFVGYVN